MNPNERNEEKQLELVTNDKNAQLINKIQVDLLRTILPMDRSARMAVKYMKIIRESRTKMLAIQEELLKKLKERKADCMTQSLRKLENELQIKWRTTLDAWDKEKRNRLVFSILVEQVRRIRSRRCPQMAGKIMKKLQDRHLIFEKLLEELLKRVNERKIVRQAKDAAQKELVKEIKKKEEMKREEEMTERQNRLQMEIMSFIPRKLFLNGVESFKTVPRAKPEIAAKVENGRKEEQTISNSKENKYEPQIKRGTKSKATLKNRLKRFFGFH
ncbi:arginine and glutamate-rich protein 1 [Magallana gigas]|uniref:arginine and glutamate-rich protein 1 n=1 Tax=Magallana gigas TaxID=29159 RepID=UPI0033426484